jgi:hypothetical protein
VTLALQTSTPNHPRFILSDPRGRVVPWLPSCPAFLAFDHLDKSIGAPVYSPIDDRYVVDARGCALGQVAGDRKQRVHVLGQEAGTLACWNTDCNRRVTANAPWQVVWSQATETSVA